MNITVDDTTNQSTALAVDIVCIENKKLAAIILALPSSDWFNKKLDLQRTYPKDLRVSSWEWVPGQVVRPFRVPDSRSANAIVLFANYATPGAHRAVLPDHGTVSMTFNDKDFVIASAK